MALKPILWHNPRCSKSRQTLALLQDRGITPDLRLYLQDPPTSAELVTLQRQLDRPVAEFIRRREPAFRTAGLTVASDDAALIAAIVRNPILLERPILVVGDKARVGRPPEAVLDLI